LLLLGLTKGGTLFSMLLSAGVYWTIWGWKFAFGIVLSIYIHEMGHVQALQRYGIKATAPMFIPGIGAVIRLKQYRPTPARTPGSGSPARSGDWAPRSRPTSCTAPPASGCGARIAHFGAWVNLFNLVPVWQLDGARGFRALTANSAGSRLQSLPDVVCDVRGAAGAARHRRRRGGRLQSRGR